MPAVQQTGAERRARHSGGATRLAIRRNPQFPWPRSPSCALRAPEASLDHVYDRPALRAFRTVIIDRDYGYRPALRAFRTVMISWIPEKPARNNR
jgi:hypothetical protein